MKTALLVIDVQNDYFTSGRFPLEGAEDALKPVLEAIDAAKRAGHLIIGVQHIAGTDAPFLAEGSKGAELHPAVKQALTGQVVINKHHADSFLATELETLLKAHQVSRLHLTGMMTQHCVTHTALSPAAKVFEITVIGSACAAPTQAIHAIALSGLSDRHAIV